MRVSSQIYRLADPMLHHTVTSGQLNRAMQNPVLRPARRDQKTALVRVLHANHKESRTMVRRPGLSKSPITQLQVELCTNLQALVLSISTYPRRVLPPKLLRDYDTLAPRWPISSDSPLANLCSFEIGAIEYLRDDLDLESNDWFLLLASLPRMKTISVPTITEQAFPSPQEQATPQEQAALQEQLLNLKSLALTSQPLTPGLLEAVLKTFPLLEELSVTWPEKGNTWPTVADIWPQLGQALCEHGTSLHKIHFACKRKTRGSLINLSSLHNLKSLALPIDALISEPAGRYRVLTATGDDGPELFWPLGPGEGADTFTIPLNYLLPPDLGDLTITDHWEWWADAYRLDNQLRDLMANPTFSELHSIRLRRSRPFVLFGGMGWSGHWPDRDWQVLERTRSTKRNPEPAFEPRLREI